MNQSEGNRPVQPGDSENQINTNVSEIFESINPAQKPIGRDLSQQQYHGFRRKFAAQHKINSRIAGFYELSMPQRRDLLRQLVHLPEEMFPAGDQVDRNAFSGKSSSMTNGFCASGLSDELVDIFIENGIGSFGLPLGIATNFMINGIDFLVPMAVEESSVLAAASHGAKIVRRCGGFRSWASDPIMTGQIQFTCDSLPDQLIPTLKARREEILGFANAGQERLIARGGGAKSLDFYFIEEISSLVITLDVDTRDAMGANIVNTMCERISRHIKDWIPGQMGLRILTNLTHKRMAFAHCLITPESIRCDKTEDPSELLGGIAQAYAFAKYDVSRACTNNKGIMNGIDPVMIATGNDWRAIEAGAHAYASLSGRYLPMAKWEINSEGNLEGSIGLPMAVGTVGGVTKLHPMAKACLKILGNPNAIELAQVAVCVGLAQNLAALRALASEGIQKGHMGLHQKNLRFDRRELDKSKLH